MQEGYLFIDIANLFAQHLQNNFGAGGTKYASDILNADFSLRKIKICSSRFTAASSYSRYA